MFKHIKRSPQLTASLVVETKAGKCSMAGIESRKQWVHRPRAEPVKRIIVVGVDVILQPTGKSKIETKGEANLREQFYHREGECARSA